MAWIWEKYTRNVHGDFQTIKNDQRLKNLLHESERVLEYSQRKPHVFSGWLCLITGTAAGIDSAMYTQAMPQMSYVVLAALILIYIGVWILFLCQREKVYVTNERVLYLRVNCFGGAGQTVSIPMRSLSSVRLYKSGITYKSKAYSGTILLVKRDKSEKILPFLQNGQYVQEVIGNEIIRISDD